MIGHVFAQRYQLEEFIGKGGMALVFRAKDMRTEHDVAVKILRPEFNGDQEFIERFRGLTDALLDNPAIGGLCYTQLTDVEQEVNGLYTYDRQVKFDPAIFKAILQRKAACEE